MFTETIAEIELVIEWIDYELGRQSTNKDQRARLKYRRQELYNIKDACTEYMKLSDCINNIKTPN